MSAPGSLLPEADRLPVQAFEFDRTVTRGLWVDGKRPTIPRTLGEAAWEGYAVEGHGSQSCERVHERGGFSLAEIGLYLARAVDEGRVLIEVVG